MEGRPLRDGEVCLVPRQVLDILSRIEAVCALFGRVVVRGGNGTFQMRMMRAVKRQLAPHPDRFHGVVFRPASIRGFETG